MKLVVWKRACATIFLFLAAASVSSAQTFNTLLLFGGADGAQPYAGLVQGTDGNLYGTTTAGGTHGHGTVFRITTSGTLSTIYNFCAMPNCEDGEYPSTLLLAGDGNFYGAASGGGLYGAGLIFKMPAGGKPTPIYNFCSETNCPDGYAPQGPLIQGTDGNFWGTTHEGGSDNSGTVFELSPGGKLTTIHSFQYTDGYMPNALIQATDGNFYGTTYSGGMTDCYYWSDCGTVFKITPGGTLTTLYSFDFTHGATPYAPLIEANNGKFYGTTYYGGYESIYGCVYGCGTVFRITAEGVLTTVTTFRSAEAQNPTAPLIQATDGNLYGTALLSEDCTGEIFEITLSGTFNNLYCFGQLGQFLYPEAGLFQSTNGVLYGTTVGDGGWEGSVYSESVGLGPFAISVPSAGKAGQGVILLGTNLTGTTSVTFNGKGARFKVVSATEITATVPAGATTGTIQVVTPGGTLSSNIPFRVIQ